jgi:hypothetical protein
MYDAKVIRRSSSELWYGKKEPHSTRQLKLELSFDIALQTKALTPLFHVLANVLADNIADGLVERYGYYYAASERSEYTSHKARETFSFRANRKAIPSLTDEIEVCEEDIEMILKLGLVPKLAKYLRSATYSEAWQAPDELKVYEATDVLVGAKGWRELASEENIKRLLHDSVLTLKYGREEQVIHLAKI